MQMKTVEEIKEYLLEQEIGPQSKGWLEGFICGLGYAGLDDESVEELLEWIKTM